jgi:hypothetical protein
LANSEKVDASKSDAFDPHPGVGIAGAHQAAKAGGEMTTADLIWDLWRKCLLAAREANTAAATVQKLISSSRDILAEQGCSQPDSDYVLADIYTRIHWDWALPSDRIFETLLAFELEKFFQDRGFAN